MVYCAPPGGGGLQFRASVQCLAWHVAQALTHGGWAAFTLMNHNESGLAETTWSQVFCTKQASTNNNFSCNCCVKKYLWRGKTAVVHSLLTLNGTFGFMTNMGCCSTAIWWALCQLPGTRRCCSTAGNRYRCVINWVITLSTLWTEHCQGLVLMSYLWP